MSDRLNDELLSAYLDDEVTAEERVKVEKALLDSPETRTAFESLVQVRDRMRSIPRMTLPTNFHERVLRELQERTPVQPAARSGHAGKPGKLGSSAGTGNWLQWAVVAGSIAAILVVAALVMINRNDTPIGETPNTPIAENTTPPENSTPPEVDIAENNTNTPDEDAIEPDEDVMAPDEDAIAKGNEHPEPDYIMIYDVAFTRRAQDNDAFGQAVRGAGIIFDPDNGGVQLDSNLEQDLLDTRHAAVAGQPAVNLANEPFDVIDMVYVRGTSAQLDAIFNALIANDQVRLRTDFAFDPQVKQVLNSVGEQTWEVAKADFPDAPRSYAYRVNLRIVLHSPSRSGFLGKFPTPTIKAQLIPDDAKKGGSSTGIDLPVPPKKGANQPKPVAPADSVEDSGEIVINELLVIRRNLTGDFPSDEEASDEEATDEADN